MKLTVFSIYDSKAESFVQPFFSPTPGTAMRSFEEACNDSETNFSKHAGDYTLYQLGTFEHNTGKFELLETPINLGLAQTFQRATPQLREA